MKKFLKNSIYKEFFSVGLIIIAIYFSSRALFHEGFFRTIDDISVVRIHQLYLELTNFSWDNFPVRLGSHLSHGYGYALYLFYSPLSYYLGALAMLLGNLSDIMATKLTYVIPLIIGPLICYWTLRQKVNRIPALTGAILYAFFPFRGFEIYTRGGIAEAFGTIFVTFTIGSWWLMQKNKQIGFLLTALGVFLTITSHNISAILLLALAICYGLLSKAGKSYWMAHLIGILSSAFYWLPMISYLPIVKVNYSAQNTNFVLSQFVDLNELFNPLRPYLYGGALHSWLFWLPIILIIFIKLNLTKEIKRWLVIFLILYISMSNLTKFLWELFLPIARLIQFPWRLLIILATVIPLLVSLLLNQIKSSKYGIILSILSIMLFIPYIKSFQPKEYSYFYAYNAEDTGPCATSWGEEYLPTWVIECINKPPDIDVFLTKEGEFNVTKLTQIKLQGHYNSPIDNTLMIHRYYFPGWQVLVDGNLVKIDYSFSPAGIIEAYVPKGNHNFEVSFGKTPIMFWSDIISFITIFFCLGYFAVQWCKRYIFKKKT